MELKEGTYIRTKDGIIDKVIIDYKGHCNNPNCNYKHISCKYNYYDESKVIKTSNNIIDLIEVGDYVNGYKVVELNKKRIGFGISKISCHYCYFNDDKIEIKSIITKEQFESMKYSLEG